MTDFNTFLGVAIFCLVLPVALMGSLLMHFLKKNETLRDNVKEVAKKKGQEALVKGIEWLLKKK